ncbi:MAG: winged helix-turn-helix domain-containing protein, partial [Myxococcales bacterium]|nr:winged helix-turn-helix domain-containing protein [Myxococcales bacterium]
MTFTEAALEVLRSAGEPLHYKKITELAIERNLLSHVGKTPEVTMSSRLATMVKKDRGQAPIVKIKPGVFALREGAEVPEAGEAPAEEITEVEEARTEEAPTTAEPALPGSEVFPEEEDDDDPILAGLEADDDDDEKRGRRRRRRRRGRGGDDDGDGDDRRNARGDNGR